MAHLIRMPRAVRRRQPQGAVEVNWRHPLARQLVFSVVPGVVLNGKWTVVGDTSTVITQTGIARSFDDTKYAIQDDNLLSSISNQCTWLWLGRWKSSSSFIFGNTAPDNLNYNAGLYITSLAYPAFYIRTSSVTSAQHSVTLNSTSNYFLVGVYDGSTLTLYKNGVSVATSGQSGNVSQTSGTHIAISRWNNNGVTQEMQLGVVFSRALSEIEVKSLNENPWQLFRPAPARFILIPSAGGGTSPIYQDGLLRWHILQAIQQDSSLRWDVRISAQNDQLVRWNLLEGILAETSLRWNNLAAIQQDSLLRWDVASALLAVQQDASIRWNLLTTTQQDVITRWNALANIESDLAARWNLLTAAQQDIILHWNTLTRVEQDRMLRWNALTTLQQDQSIRWDILSEVLSAQNNTTLRWNTLSAVQQETLLRWNIAIAVEQSLATRWNLLNAVEVSQTTSWNIAIAVANEIITRWDISALTAVLNDATLRWEMIGVAENEIELRWSVGDATATPAIRVFLVRGEDRTFQVVTEDRTFGV